MCGILCAFKITKDNNIKSILLEILNPKLLELLKNRGPDKFEQLIITSSNVEEILFAGSVLWHQGDQLAVQPLQIDNGILIFNGDIFNIDDPINNESDSVWLLTKINKCKNDEDLMKIFQKIKGPYSFVYYNKIENSLYFGRDSLGRNSLIIENDTEILKISSISQIPTSSGTKTMELPSVGIFKIDMNTKQNIILYPWKNLTEEQFSNLHELESILFHEDLIISKSINPEWLMPCEANSNANYDFYDVVSKIEEKTNIFEKLLQNEFVTATVNQLINLLEKSVKERVITTRKHCTDCLNQILKNNSINIVCNHEKIGILFSGGIDCSILAALTHKFVNVSEPIDLINVAFESVANKNDENVNWNVPDRISARDSYEELKNLHPERKWNLVEINVSRSELYEKLGNHIGNLIYPLHTVLDESLGCAFWFGARGIGTIDGVAYKSNCRIILVGTGADELFGGYVRHRNSYERCKGDHLDKLNALKNELNLDWNRISSRNLGRDDRVIADHGKTSRAPFIEENLMRFIQSLKPSQKCCFLLEQGLGDKLLLRLCGHKLNLRNSTTLKKRAIQFGSKIADKKQNATDISKFLK